MRLDNILFKVKLSLAYIGMFTFHYLICKDPCKIQEYGSSHYNVKKLIFENNQLTTSDDLVVSAEKLNLIKKDLIENQFTEINDCKIDLDSFLKNIDLTKIN